MKKMKNVMLAITGSLFMLSVAMVSCKKDDTTTPATPAPTITALSPTHGLIGATVTITGTNLAGATVKFGSVTATTTSVSATSITVTVPAGATTGNVTVTTTGGTSAGSTFTVDAAGPSYTSNSVAAANLIAHWTFDGTTKEDKSGTTPSSTTGVTTSGTGGQIGGYASFSNGVLVYPTIAATNTPDALAAGFTFTTWAQLPTAANLTSLWEINGNIGDIWATAGFTFRHSSSDSLDFDGTITHVNGTGTHSTAGDDFLEGPAADFKTAPTAWAFIAMVYDTTGGSKKILYYGNGVLKGTKTIATTAIPTTEQFELICTTSFGNTGRNNITFGSFNYSPTPFAAGGGASASWQNTSLPAGTKVDDTRLFNKSLSKPQLDSLYAAGSAGN